MIIFEDLALTIIPKVIAFCSIDSDTKNKLEKFIADNYNFYKYMFIELDDNITTFRECIEYLHELDINGPDYEWHIKRINQLLINYLTNVATLSEKVLFIIDNEELFKYLINQFKEVYSYNQFKLFEVENTIN